MMMADNGVRHRVAELSRQPGDGEGRRPREVLDRLRGLSLPGRQPAARDEARRRRSARARVLTRTPVRRDRDRPTAARASRSANGKVLEAEHVLLDRAAVACGTRSRSTRCCRRRWRRRWARTSSILMALKAPFWRRAELAPDLLTDGPVSTDVARAPTARRAPARRWCAFSGGPPPTPAASGRRPQRNENYLAELEQGLQGHPPRASCGRGSWTGRRIRGSKASYSFPAPGQVTTQGPTLRQGIGRLHFAGEYTSYAFMGYMEGALNSGAALARAARAARRRDEEDRGVSHRGSSASADGVDAGQDRSSRARTAC